jgi:hypothetical protein
MEQSTTQRRLVKSPPELWAEISNETALGRHLAEFGEIRIIRVDPETTVAWEGDRASGTVELAPAGWGTKVVLTARPVPPKPALELVTAVPECAAPEAAEPELAEPEQDPDPVAIEPERDRVAPRADPRPPVRRGFLARLLRGLVRVAVGPRVRAEIPAPGPPVHDPSPPAPAPDPTPPGPGPDPTPPLPGPDPSPSPPGPDPVPPAPEPDPTPPSIEAPDPPPAAAELDPERTVAILTQMLDDLGADHRRLTRA